MDRRWKESSARDAELPWPIPRLRNSRSKATRSSPSNRKVIRHSSSKRIHNSLKATRSSSRNNNISRSRVISNRSSLDINSSPVTNSNLDISNNRVTSNNPAINSNRLIISSKAPTRLHRPRYNPQV